MTVAYAPARPMAGVSLKSAAAALVVLVLAMAAGNRWFGFGRDYLFYTEFYDRLGLATRITEERFEPGFTAGAWLFKETLGLPYAAYATTLVAGALAAKFALFFRHCERPLVACLVYGAAFYPLHEYTQIRIAVALAFGLWSAVVAVTGRPILGGVLIIAGAAFQSSVAIVGLGVAIALLLRLRLPIALLICACVVAVARVALPSDPVAVLAAFNPLAQDYLTQLDADVPNFFSVANLTTMIVAAAMVPFVIFRRDHIAAMGLVMSLLSLISFVALRDIPTFAHRFRELFAAFTVLLAFGIPATATREGLRLVMIVSAAWVLHQYIADGLVG